MGTLQFSGIHLYNFYGIEINHFSAEIGRLSLWLAQHQMNVEFLKEFGNTSPTLPLQDSGNIVYANAAQINWESVCPKNESDEIYIIGNPPFGGRRNQADSQKKDLEKVFKTEYKNLDYVALWYKLGADYIRGNPNAKMALVSTNSICQGEQVAMLWPRVLGDNLEICFAYQSFKWKNSARNNAGVTVIIVGIANKSENKKYIFNGVDGQNNHLVRQINPYLTNGEIIYISRHTKPISDFPQMEYGNMAIDGGNLLLGVQEKNDLESNTNNNFFIKKILGADELLNGKERYCLWIKDIDLDKALMNSSIAQKISKTKEFRLNSSDIGTRSLAEKPHQFREMKECSQNAIIIPTVTSERREYIPIEFVDNKTVIIAPNQAIYDPEPWIFGVISSKMHMVWVRAVGGRLKTDLRYSSSLIYNTFPFPPLTDSYKQALEQCVDRVIFTREEYPELTLAQLYDPKKMPENLRQTHADLDSAIDTIYMRHLNRRKPLESDGERLEVLFEMYLEMVKGEN